MEVSLAADFSPSTASDSKHSSSKSPKAVNFEEGEEHLEGRKKYLTAKYGSHQMSLIRKRLGVEMWMLDELSKLYPPTNTSKELDLDELLDIDEDKTRRTFLQTFLTDSHASAKDVNTFIEALLVEAHKL